MDMTNDIGEFLTSRRANVTPEQAGLPSYGKRRVAGLRREEVASLAGVSIDYYRRLERGLVSGVSDSVLEALARALQLDDAERAHLHDLARAANPVAPSPRRAARQLVRPVVRRILDALDAPAIARAPYGAMSGPNALGRALYAPLFESREQPANSARFTFLDPAAFDFYPDWDRVALRPGRPPALRSRAHQDPSRRGASRRRIITGVEDSLRRLGTDWIDLYQIHRPDPHTDIDETLGALLDLVHQGKVRYIGHSTVPASEIVEAHWTAERRDRERFRCEQPPYSMLVRAVEHDVLPTCQRHGMGVIPYSPLAGGWLSGRYRKDAEITGPTSAARPQARFDMSDPANQRKLDAADQLARLADDAGVTPVEMAIAFVLRHPAVTAAIIGPRTMEHLESQLAAADVTLSGDVLDRIDAINPPGVTINPADNGWTAQSLQPAGRRR